MNKYTTLKLSKLLHENGCKLKTLYCHQQLPCGKYKLMELIEEHRNVSDYVDFPAYDILNDICVKYAKEFFGEEYKVRTPGGLPMDYTDIAQIILGLLQKDNKDKAGDIIWRATIFNHKNKKK